MRRERMVGGALVVLALALGLISYFSYLYSTSLADQIVALGGKCITSEGCIHQDATDWLIALLIPSVLVLATGIYTMFFLQVSTYGDKLRGDDAFAVMLRSLDADEAKVMRIVRDEEGITQATLKYRADLSKSKLSQVLSELERRELISRETKGSTKKVFVRAPKESPEK